MVAKYKIYPWEFNVTAWAMAVNDAVAAVGSSDLSELLGVHRTTINNWANGRLGGGEGFPYPSMTNLLKVVNLLDLDVRDMFILGDE